jgi:hypothetical protein
MAGKNVQDFGAVGDGITNDISSIQSAVNSYPSGATGGIFFPSGTYDFGGSTYNPGSRSIIAEYDPGASRTNTVSFGAAYPARAGEWEGLTRVERVARADRGSPQVGDAVCEFKAIELYGGNSAGAAIRWDYRSSNHPGDGFDILQTRAGTWNRVNNQTGGCGMLDWSVAISPDIANNTTLWAQVVAEWNIVNRGSDYTQAWPTRNDAAAQAGQFTVVHLLVPESSNFQQGGETYDAYAGTVYAHSADIHDKNNDDFAMFWIAMSVEPNAIRGGGVSVSLCGNARAGSQHDPLAAIRVQNRHTHGITMVDAVFSGNAIETPGFAVDGEGEISGTSAVLEATGSNTEATLSAAAGFSTLINLKRNQVSRIAMGMNPLDDLEIYSYNTDGSFRDIAARVERSSGVLKALKGFVQGALTSLPILAPGQSCTVMSGTGLTIYYYDSSSILHSKTLSWD